MSHRGVDCRHCTMWLPESFLSSLQKVFFFWSGFKYFFMIAVVFCTLKNYYLMQIIMIAVVGVYKFGQECLIIGILENSYTNTSNKIQLKLLKVHFYKKQKNATFTLMKIICIMLKFNLDDLQGRLKGLWSILHLKLFWKGRYWKIKSSRKQRNFSMEAQCRVVC